jgi:hypothetical protein
MKLKPTRGKGGRKKFSAAKLASPVNTLDENINLLAIGECAATQQAREVFQIVALWEKYHARPAHVSKHAAKAVGAMLRRRVRSHEEKLLTLLRGSLARIAPEVRKALFGALTRLDSQPFHAIATAIDVVRSVNESGAFQTTLVRAALLAQERFGVSHSATSLLVTRTQWASEYKKRFASAVNTDFLCRECEQRLGIFFKPDKVGRKPGNPDNSRGLTS